MKKNVEKNKRGGEGALLVAAHDGEPVYAPGPGFSPPTGRRFYFWGSLESLRLVVLAVGWLSRSTIEVSHFVGETFLSHRGVLTGRQLKEVLYEPQSMGVSVSNHRRSAPDTPQSISRILMLLPVEFRFLTWGGGA